MERGKLLCGLSNLTIKPVEVDTFVLILKSFLYFRLVFIPYIEISCFT